MVVAALALNLCLQTLRDLVDTAPADGADVEAIRPAPVGDLARSDTPPPNGTVGPAWQRALTTTPTGEGDASQVWHADGRWWGVLTSAETNEFHIWAYDRAAQAWVDTGTVVDDRPFVRPDVLWDGRSLYVVAGGRRRYRSEGITVTRFGYDPIERRWSTDPDFPVAVTGAGAGDPLIAKDPGGTLWLAYVQDGRVQVAHTDGNDAVWTPPVPLPGQDGQPLASAMSMTAHADGVSVVWVPQHTDELRIATHVSGTPVTAWDTTTRSIYGLGGIDAVGRFGDLTPTELSVRAAGAGADRRLYVAFRTSLARQGSNEDDPQILLATVDPAGQTTTSMVGEVSDHHSHPVVAIDRGRQEVLVVATSPNQLGGVYVKRASLVDPVFPLGIGEPVVYGNDLFAIDHATGSKQELDATTGLLVVGSDDVNGRYGTGARFLGGDGAEVEPPPPPPLPAGPPSTTVLVHDTFDQQPLDAPPPSAWLPKVAGPPVGAGARTVSVVGGRGRSMQLTSDEAGAGREYCRALPPVVDAPVTVEADVKVTALGTADAHLLSLGGGGPIASIRATSKGEIGFVTPEGRQPFGTLPIDVFVRVSVTVEPATRTYFVTVAPRDGGPALLALGRQPWVGARRAAADEVCVQSAAGSPGLSLVLDDLRATEG